MNMFSPFNHMRLGQVPLILGPSSWGAGGGFIAQAPTPVPPFWGEWGVVDEAGRTTASGREGPFNTIQEAFNAAAQAASDHGAELLPTNGFAQVTDSIGQGVGPVT
jgi:hypothetical protein